MRIAELLRVERLTGCAQGNGEMKARLLAAFSELSKEHGQEALLRLVALAKEELARSRGAR